MKFTIARRIVQISIIALFIAGNIFGVKVLQGNLSSSTLFGSLNLSDPYAILQLFVSGFSIGLLSISGAVIVLVFYALIAPRAFCGWVCPVNLFTDLAAFVKKILNINKTFVSPNSNLRYYLLFLSLVFSFIFATPVFESISFISALTRSIIYLSSDVFAIVLAIFAVEILSKRLICSTLCPLGAFWAVVSKFSLIRIKHKVANCTHCAKCFTVCPEKNVLSPVGKKDAIIGSECISCGRCVEACNDNALNFSILNYGDKK